jgi:hypothetical protein
MFVYLNGVAILRMHQHIDRISKTIMRDVENRGAGDNQNPNYSPHFLLKTLLPKRISRSATSITALFRSSTQLVATVNT